MESLLERTSEAAVDSAPAVTEPRRSWLRRLRFPIIAGVILVAEVAALLTLAIYGGYFSTLPPSPPALHVVTNAKEVAVRPATYCWLTPGRARCVDASAAPAIKSLPALKVRTRAIMRLRFDTTIPTDCAASAVTANTTTGTAGQVGIIRGDSLAVALAPGWYRLDIFCRWHSQPQLRWLKGQGDATYSLALTVVSH